MHDFHIHIGQFNELFYDYHDVFTVLKLSDVSEITLAYLTPKFDSQKNAVEFYHAVVNELKNAKEYAFTIGLSVNFLYWADPLVLETGISLTQVFQEFPYFGIALHPVLHEWSSLHKKKTDRIFRFASLHNLPIFLHTGVSERDTPLQFEKWFSEFPEVEVHLAHCKDPQPIIELFSKYTNLVGDTAFCPSDSYNEICDAGFRNRMFFGTDFPITHYYEQFGKSLITQDSVTVNSLIDNYRNQLKEQSKYVFQGIY